MQSFKDVNPIKDLAALNPTQRAYSFFEEFKSFAFKGNVIDLAVGVVIGAAFGKIIGSLVDNIVMPFVSILVPAKQAYQNWTLPIGSQEIKYGLFLADIVNFLVVAAALFVFIVKFLGWVMRARKTEAAAPPPPPTKDQELLMEIRDLLKQAALKS